ncbi:MAG: aspartate/glutamate racemase family protein [Collimonas sp.]|uniref:aspartate/glutamate racemase family protein n=1 Tax=Collimonas sp. TaxID=1963772 RepID=UPI00326509E9
MIIRGGRAIYGESVGILVLDTKFPRIPGDVGNATTFDFPVRYKVVRGANPEQIVGTADRARALLPAFIEAARELENDGVRAITTTCGFLTVVQDDIAEAVNIPVITSSLFLIPMMRRMLGPKRSIGVVTADAQNLSVAHLRAAGIEPGWNMLIRGMESCPSFGTILGKTSDPDHALDVDKTRQEVVDVCRAMQAEVPGLGAFLFECTNLQPYAAAVQSATGLPIFGIYHVVNLLHSAAIAPDFGRGYL